ncbi:MAG: hypothetical protein K9M99_10575 [Candidatus Cloacimonetes bacterium]|nr:hypothetical protein [Candidatus Cloacimonadota bacterium]
MSKTLSIIGDNLMDIAELEKAYEYYQKALKITEAHNLQSEILKIYENLEIFWEKQQNYEELSVIRKKYSSSQKK